MNIISYLIFMLLSMVTLYSAADAEEISLQDLLTGKAHLPATLTAKELNPSWNIFAISADESAQVLMAHGRDSRHTPALPNVVYYTRGAIVTCGNISYLAAYRRNDPISNQSDDVPHHVDNYENQLEFRLRYALTEKTELTLVLLNLRQTAVLANLHPFDPKTDLTDSQQVEEMLRQHELLHARTTILSDLRQIALAMMMYAQDNNETLSTNLTVLGLSTSVQLTPVTHKRYLFNTSLEGKSLGQFADPVNTIVAYQPDLEADGTRGAAFLDGHVQFLNAVSWKDLAKKSGIK